MENWISDYTQTHRWRKRGTTCTQAERKTNGEAESPGGQRPADGPTQRSQSTQYSMIPKAVLRTSNSSTTVESKSIISRRSFTI